MLIPLVLGLSVLALAVAVGLARWVLGQDNGTPQMRTVSDAIQEGAAAFLRRQYRTIFSLSVVLAVLIFVLYAFFRTPHPGEPSATTMALWTTLSFVLGAVCSGIAGLIGMFVAVRANIRTASAARSSLKRALHIALRGGAVSGLFVVAMSLLGVGGLYTIVHAANVVPPERIPLLIVGYAFGTAFLAGVGFLVATRWLLNPAIAPDAWWHFFLCGVIGVLTSVAFVYITQYYTEYRYRPVKSIAAASVTGPATNIIAGFAVALECTALPTFTISAAIILSYRLGASSGLAHAGLFGTAVATMGMLGTAAYILAMDTFGPITDNAGGIIEMSHQPEAIRKRTDRLDAVGNTTKALTKGYAIGSAALAAFLLFSAYLDEVAALGSPLAAVDISKPEVFVGGLFGAMLVFWFSALAISAVTKAAVSVIQEVRRQFQADPGILKGTSRPDYGRAVDIVTVGALKAMVAPGLLAVGMPIAVGLVFKVLFHVGAETVASFLMVGTIAGILMATLLNNGGGAWDNAKKFIETGEYGGKGSPTHKAAVVGDTVGDPFKDTAGPSLHVLIKLLSTVTLVLAPLFV